MPADFDRQGRLIGIEVLDASEVLQHKAQFEVMLTSEVKKVKSDEHRIKTGRAEGAG